MRMHEFIFSNRLYHRLVRHTAFWVVCWIFFLGSYFFPTNCFPGWKLQGEHVLIYKQLGFFQFSILSLMLSSRNIIFQMIFTYIIIYFLMPKYLIREKYWAFVTCIVLLILVVATMHYYLADLVSNSYLYSLFDIMKKTTRHNSYNGSFSMVLFYYPFVGGIALSIKLMKRWWLKQQESLQLTITKSNAELQLLKAQVHPHFLFNTLNNIYSFTLTSSPKAPEMIKKLSGLLHYIIYECNQPLVSLDKEFKMIHDYMALEKVRYGEQMDMTTDIRGDYKNETIAPLLLIPFVENSFKHGTSKMLSKPWVSLNIIVENGSLYFMLNNSKPEEYIDSNGKNGIGLANVQKRLQLLYLGKHELKMTSEPEHFTVLLRLDLVSASEKQGSQILEKETYHYEMA